MHRVRRNQRCAGTSTSINAAADTGAERSDKAAGTRTDPGHHDAGNESVSASGNTATQSGYAAWNCSPNNSSSQTGTITGANYGTTRANSGTNTNADAR